MSAGVLVPDENLGDQIPAFRPMGVLPCANANAVKHFACENPGKHACSSCRLVSYCSKECQRAHWTIHKLDCKDPIRSTNWKPGWVFEGRVPSFLLPVDKSRAVKIGSQFEDTLSFGSSLWGNVPALDIVNLRNNEKSPKANLSLAFAASGDIRNIIATVNALGSDYSGKVTILLNDLDPSVVSRNIILLLILGTIPDEVASADIALHFWYSVFMPMEYRLRILSMVSSLLTKDSFSGPIVASLGPHSTLTCQASDDVWRLLVENLGSEMSPEQAQAEYRRVRTAPSRADLRDRMYMGLKPSHRLAFLEYRRFGIVLPFGALNAHFNMSNTSLFANGRWLQSDYADPLESWDLDKVFSAGKAHGAQPEDVYGCLYFFLSDQLRAFARHIRQHHISFHVFSAEACTLARNLAQGKLDLPSTTRFDRIDVSNIMDPNYVGIGGVVNAWGPLLAKTKDAALIGYFMNWVFFAANARVADAGPSAMKGAMNLMKKSNRIHSGMDGMLAMNMAMNDIDAFYENYLPFSKFWKDRGGDDIELRLRTIHKIVPHRIGTIVGAKADALPDFGDDERWYRYSQLTSRTWAERYVELIHSLP